MSDDIEEELIPMYVKRKEVKLENLSTIKKKIIEILEKENKTLCDLIGLDWKHVEYIFDGESGNTLICILSEICLQFGYKLEINFTRNE